MDANWSGRAVAITGASGFVGQHLAFCPFGQRQGPFELAIVGLGPLGPSFGLESLVVQPSGPEAGVHRLLLGRGQPLLEIVDPPSQTSEAILPVRHVLVHLTPVVAPESPREPVCTYSTVRHTRFFGPARARVEH